MADGPGRAVTVEAPAKVNLFLHVLGRRADGYHDIETVLQGVDLRDTVTVELTGGGLRLDVAGADVGPTEENLAYRAAAAYREATGFDTGVHIGLEKRIPAGAGLGGGSSDAAAVLRCLASLAGDMDRARLQRVGAGIGSDVPFFLGGSPLGFAVGRGERLEPLPPLPVRDVVLVLTPVHVSTGAAYEALGAPPLIAHGHAERERPMRLDGWDAVVGLAHNDFERVVARAHPEVRASLDALQARGASPAMLSGSGGACFGLFGAGEDTDVVARELTDELGWPCVVVRTLGELPDVEAVDA